VIAMQQMKCPNCGSRTTDFELANYGGRCIRCRPQPAAPPPGAEEPLEAARHERPPGIIVTYANNPDAVTTPPAMQQRAGDDVAPGAGGGPTVSYQQIEREASKLAGMRNMFFGALWCIGGLAVTGFTYAAASAAGGGRYVVAGGAILFGGLQFIRGLLQYAAGARSDHE
jgi:hypothetical protein